MQAGIKDSMGAAYRIDVELGTPALRVGAILCGMTSAAPTSQPGTTPTQRKDRRYAIGLRGPAVNLKGEFRHDDVVVRRLASGLYWALLMQLVFILGVVLCITLLAFKQPTVVEPIAARHAVPVLVVLLLALLAAIRAGAMRLVGRTEGLERVNFLGRESIAWADVRSLRLEASVLEITYEGSSGTMRGLARGRALERFQLTDVVLEHSPALAGLAWGTGLARVRRPEPDGSELPFGVTASTDELLIEGPRGSRLVIDGRHPMREAIREALEARLLPALAESEG